MRTAPSWALVSRKVKTHFPFSEEELPFKPRSYAPILTHVILGLYSLTSKGLCVFQRTEKQGMQGCRDGLQGRSPHNGIFRAHVINQAARKSHNLESQVENPGPPQKRSGRGGGGRVCTFTTHWFVFFFF